MSAERRWLWYGAGLGVGLGVLRAAVLPAAVRAPRLVDVRGAGPYLASLAWTYGPGARPVSLIFDLETETTQGSVTTDGEVQEADILLGRYPRGPYRLTVSATYRSLGVAYTIVTTTNGEGSRDV